MFYFALNSWVTREGKENLKSYLGCFCIALDISSQLTMLILLIKK